jgi:hypothetical protein
LINFYPLEIPLIEGEERGRSLHPTPSQRVGNGNLPLPPHRGGMEENQKKKGKFII